VTFADAIERHRATLARTENAAVRQLIGPLVSTLDDAVARLAAAGSDAQRRRLTATIAETRAAIVGAYQQLGEALPESLVTIASSESEFTAGMLSRAVGVSFDALPLASLEQVVRGPIVEGSVMSASLARQRVDLLSALRVSTSASLIEGEGIAGAARRFGRAADVSRSSAEAWTRTAINTVENRAALESYRASGVVEDVRWLVTKDERLCPVCRPLNGKSLRDIGGQPPPRHFRCRCSIVPIVSLPGIPDFEVSALAG
jgi:SPP1 gp7 family putative phage head morphogenesis protein